VEVLAHGRHGRLSIEAKIAPFSQELEPPPNPGRFRLAELADRERAGAMPCTTATSLPPSLIEYTQTATITLLSDVGTFVEPERFTRQRAGIVLPG
jgi:hypothetical protein